MRKLLMFISLVLLSTITDAQVLKSVHVATSGALNELLSDTEKITITNLTITGNLDDRDFKIMRDNMPLLAALDISEVSISAYSGIDGTYINGNQIISYPANELPQYAFYNNNTSSGKPRLKSIILPNSITSIGSAAFYYSGLTGNLIIPESVKSIGSSAFGYCSGLTGQLIIPNSVTSIGNAAFKECRGFTGELIIPDNVTVIGHDAFNTCNKIESIKIGNSVTSIDNYAFKYCFKVNNITLGSSLSYIGSCAFQYCNFKTINCLSIIPPTLETSGGNAFTDVNKTNCTLYVPIGSYTKYLIATGWTDFISIIEGTSALNNTSNFKIKIYPNPANDYLKIEGIEGNAILRITEMSGKLLLEQTIQKCDVVSIGKLPKGIYFVKLISNEGIIEKKVIKN